ncbi:MAG: hypothetical protein QOD98_787 [Nocardioidaceae bacterium]|nr:hypothetical protein [Nocardioidaceae bacterium]
MLLVAALGASGCADDADVTRIHDYVALGDSFTSGAGLPDEVVSTGKCGQSRLSYPYLVAESIHADLGDASCGGATTENGAVPQQRPDGTWPAQLDRLRRTTDLVTVGLGANDFSWFFGLMFGCTATAAADPTGGPCQKQGPASASDLTALPPQIAARLEALLNQVHRRAPDARVLLVGYPQPVPARGTCPELPLATGDYPFVRAQWSAMDAAMRRAAAAAGATYVEVLGPSDGHDICAGADAWVNGFEARPGVAAAYHPLASCQAAVAELVEKALEQ